MMMGYQVQYLRAGEGGNPPFAFCDTIAMNSYEK
jgi:hypothetical protein